MIAYALTHGLDGDGLGLLAHVDGQGELLLWYSGFGLLQAGEGAYRREGGYAGCRWRADVVGDIVHHRQKKLSDELSFHADAIRSIADALELAGSFCEGGLEGRFLRDALEVLGWDVVPG